MTALTAGTLDSGQFDDRTLLVTHILGDPETMPNAEERCAADLVGCRAHALRSFQVCTPGPETRIELVLRPLRTLGNELSSRSTGVLQTTCV